MESAEIRKRFLSFFEKRGHKIIPSASLVPENDPTTLFTSSGMQPLLPYLLGEAHPKGTRIANSQKSFRAADIDEVGDTRHTTFFEMLGNWSLGDYFKKEQLSWFFEFLTKDIGLDPRRLYVTVFDGDREIGVPRDEESIALWKELFGNAGIDASFVALGSESEGYKVGLQNGRIFGYRDKNWWSRSGAPKDMPDGEPGGPDSEVFYDFGTPHDPRWGEHCHPNCDCGRFMEIGNSVFMEFVKRNGAFEKLSQRNVDFGGGLERISAAKNATDDIFRIDTLGAIVTALEKMTGVRYEDHLPAFRVVADHLRAAVFMLGDGVLPSNNDRGYVLRRLIRRAVRFGKALGVNEEGYRRLIDTVVDKYIPAYQNLKEDESAICHEFIEEVARFTKTLDAGLLRLSKLIASIAEIEDQGQKKFIPARDAFDLYQSYGFPLELTEEVAAENEIFVDRTGFEKLFMEHQALSRSGAEKKFKGGLADGSETVVKYHTATHLLHQALHDVLGDEVSQKGSNITSERLRFDFVHDAKMTDEEKKRVEEIVNTKIAEDLPVKKVVLPKEGALKTGARHSFNEKYGDEVSIYYIGHDLERAYSKEFCGGPHVTHTGQLGKFKIIKEEAVAAGIRRIKAVLN